MNVGQTKAATSAFKYNAALDGLRGIAVLAVMFGHFSVPGFYAGGNGVDIFFVVSGYIITRVLLRALEQDRPFLAFYFHRFARLFPPLLLVCLSIFLFPDKYLTTWGATLNSLNAILYVSNWLRAFPTIGWPSYMAHTWSLSIEEQFYVVWPLILLVAFKFDRDRLKWVLLATMLLSLIVLLACWTADVSQTQLYNGFHGRLPGMALGGCAAVFPLRYIRPSVAATSLLGLYAIFWGAFKWSPLVSCLTWSLSMILISFAANNDGRALARLLQFSPLVNVGLVSYGAYLWHWPIVMLFGAAQFTTLPTAIIGIALSLALAYLTARFIETPARHFRSTLSDRAANVLGGIVLTWTVLAVLGGLVFFYGGFITVAPY